MDLPCALLWSSIPVCIFGFIGNVLVIQIVYKSRVMHTPTNFLLVNMAVSDVIAILLFLIHDLTTYLLYEHIGENLLNIACKSIVVITTSAMVSSITLVVLSVERYNALLKPFNNGLRLNEDNIKKAIVFIWITSALLSLPNFFFEKWSEAYSTCSGPFNYDESRTSRIYLLVYAAIFYIQATIMFFCYGSLIRGLYFTNTVCPETDGERRSEKRKLVVTFLLASVGFLIGYGPGIILATLVASQHGENVDFDTYYVLLKVVEFLFGCSLCLNPIFYAFRSERFKDGFKRVLGCR